MTNFSSDFDRMAIDEMEAHHEAKARGDEKSANVHWIAAKRFLLLAEESRAAERELMEMAGEVEG